LLFRPSTTAWLSYKLPGKSLDHFLHLEPIEQMKAGLVQWMLVVQYTLGRNHHVSPGFVTLPISRNALTAAFAPPKCSIELEKKAGVKGCVVVMNLSRIHNCTTR